MNDDRILELMASVSEYMRTTDQRFEQMNQKFDRLLTVMHDGFERMSNELAGVKKEVKEVKSDVRDIKAEAAVTNRRLSATFDQAGHLTEQTDATALRITHVEQAQEPTNAELHQRPLAVENKLSQAS